MCKVSLKTYRLALAMAAIVVFLAGCVQTTAGDALPPAAAPQNTVTAPTQDVEGSADLVGMDDARTLATLKSESLRSYLATTEVRIDALTPEEALQAWTVVEARTDTAAAVPISRIRITDKSRSEVGEQSEVILTENDVFMRAPADEKWLRFSRSASAMILPGMLTPEEIAASSMELLGRADVIATDEEISGILTTHYQLTGDTFAAIAERSLPPGARLVSGQMDLWVASGGYVKQVIQEFVAEDTAGSQSRHSLTMLVLEENLPLNLSLPAANEVMELELPEPPTTEPINTGATPAS